MFNFMEKVKGAHVSIMNNIKIVTEVQNRKSRVSYIALKYTPPSIHSFIPHDYWNPIYIGVLRKNSSLTVRVEFYIAAI